MNLLDELVEAASGDGVTVATLLRRVKVLAARTQVTQLAVWVDHELSGYPQDAELPEYRGPFHTGALGHFAGPFQSGLQNAPIPEARLLKHLEMPQLFSVEFRGGASELAELANSKHGSRMPWPTDVVGYVNALLEAGTIEMYPMMGLQQAWREVPKNFLISALDAVRTRILDLALEFEQVAPTAGQADASQEDLERAQSIVTNIFGSVGNVAVASQNVQQSQLPAVGSVDELLEFVANLGVDGSSLNELRDAATLRPNETLPSRQDRVQSWLGRYLVTPTGALMGGAGGDLLARAVGSFLGGPFA